MLLYGCTVDGGRCTVCCVSGLVVDPSTLIYVNGLIDESEASSSLSSTRFSVVLGRTVRRKMVSWLLMDLSLEVGRVNASGYELLVLKYV